MGKSVSFVCTIFKCYHNIMHLPLLSCGQTQGIWSILCTWEIHVTSHANNNFCFEVDCSEEKYHLPVSQMPSIWVTSCGLVFYLSWIVCKTKLMLWRKIWCSVEQFLFCFFVTCPKNYVRIQILTVIILVRVPTIPVLILCT